MQVLPTVALCGEKSRQLRSLLSPLNRNVKDFYGGLHSYGRLGARTGVMVCVIETANMV